ncbi:MAG: outer membrane beta-barrel family protein [Lutibacter sp.]|nr:outer membrane beta-barrel family protein [Lutibacter sp.]
MRRLLLLTLIVFAPILSYSQKNINPTYAITGKIVDAATKKPLEDATVIFKSIDSNLIKFGGITNQKGNFSIDVEKETYLVSVEFISYETKILNISAITRDLNVGIIELELDTEILDEIEIVGEKKALEFKPNKIVFNVDKDIATAGSTATDILNNIPSVSVDPDGAITLRGQGNVTVMINGKISSMAKSEALKSIPAGSIEKIEVIANPGAKYKASSLGIINILLKKGKDDGFNASLTTTGGYKDYYGGLLTLNYKSKKVNFYTNLSYFQRNPVKLASSENEYFNNGSTYAFLNEKSENNSKDDGLYNTFGADFYISDKTTLSASINYSNINNNSHTLTTSDFFNAAKTKTSDNTKNYFRKLDNEIIEYIVDFEHSFKKEGQKLTSSFTYTTDLENYSNISTNTNPAFTDDDFVEKNNLKNKIFDLTFVNPISKTATFTVGYYGEYGEVPFTYSGTPTNNNIDYTDNVHAAFIDFENQSEKLYLGLGLRAEYEETTIDYSTLNTKQNKKYNDFFPSAAIEYNFNDSHSLTLSYSRGIQRPGYWELQPFEQKFSETSSYIGNPDLNPYYIDAATLKFVYYSNKFTFSPSLIFNRLNDHMELITYETGQQINGINKIITTLTNVGKLDYYGIDLTTTFKPAKILNFTGNINLLNFDQSGIFETVNLANETIIRDFNHASLNGSFSLLTQLKIPKVFDFQINAKHFLISKGAYSTRKAYTYASAAINKDLFDKDASISLTVDDIFKSNKTDRDRFNTSYFSKSMIENKYRTILLSFTYRFNQSKKDRKVDFNKKESKPNY